MITLFWFCGALAGTPVESYDPLLDGNGCCRDTSFMKSCGPGASPACFVETPRAIEATKALMGKNMPFEVGPLATLGELLK